MSKNIRISFSHFIIICLASWYIMPFVRYRIEDKYIFIAELFVGMIWALNNSDSMLRPWVRCNLIMIAFALLSAIVTYDGDLYSGLIVYVNLMLFFFPYMIFIYMTRVMQIEDMRTVMWVLIFMLFSVAISTIIAVSEDPSIIRGLASGFTDKNNDYYMTYRLKNVGGLFFAYSIPIELPALFFFAAANKKTGNTISSVIAIILIVMLTYIAYISMYTFLIIVTTIALILIFVRKRKKLYWLFIPAAVALAFILPSVFSFIATRVNSVTVSNRFMELSMLLKGVSTGDDIAYRMQLLRDHLSLFFQSPVWGNTFVSKTGTVLYKTNAHSTYLGFLSQVGVLGFSLYVMLLKNVRLSLSNFFSREKNYCEVVKICYWIMILIGAINSLANAYDLAFILCVFVPCLLYSSGYDMYLYNDKP